MTVTDLVRTVTADAIDGTPRELGRRLRSLLDRARPRGTPRLVTATIPIPRPDPIALFASAQAAGEVAAVWRQPEAGFELVAVGSAWTTTASGAGRFADVAQSWSGLVADALHHGPGEIPGTGPLLFGGFGFGPKAAQTATWAGFESGRLDVPCFLVTLTSKSTWLTAAIVVTRRPADDQAAELIRRWIRLTAPAGTPARWAAVPAELRTVGGVPSAAEWTAAVGRFAGTVGRGRLDKAVLARRVDLEGDGPIDVPAALRSLAATAPESTIFAVARGERTFLGATPELLARSRGREFETVALAGSIGRGTDTAEDDRLAAELLASAKDREEHEIVVEALRESLAPMSERLEIARRPSIVRLRHVQHLATELRGRLREPAGILGLIAQLHPTPAVGGAPRELALEMIADEERLERGWYAGPLGWVNRRGDGEFVVAIRSGVVEGRRASLFAGCGIVADSEPDREWRESEIKLRTLATALGAAES